MSIRLYEKFKSIYFADARFRDLGERYKDCRYKLFIDIEPDKYINLAAIKQNIFNNIDTKRKKDPLFYSITIECSKKKTKIFSLDKKDDISAKELKKGCIDIIHTGELIFLLALKLKYDSLSEQYSEQKQEPKPDYDNSGLLHTKEISELRKESYTEVSPLIWKYVYTQLDLNDIEKFTFLSDPKQLYHLINYFGNVGQNIGTANVFGWLNVLPENIKFFNKSRREIEGAELYNILNSVLAKWVLKPKDLDVIYHKQMTIGRTLLKYENPSLTHKVENTEANISDQSRKAFIEAEEKQRTEFGPIEKLKLYKSTIPIDPERKELQLLSYKYRWPKIIYGRDLEVKRLYNFLKHPNKNLLWWAIIGKGGVGKSRIALELCFELEKRSCWYAGFLTDPNEIDILKTWNPSKPTLIVIDYTYEKAERLGECICNSMYENSKQWKFPVRILFLERHAKSEALEQFCRSGRSIIEDNLLYNESNNDKKANFLELRSLNDIAIDSIITEVFIEKKGQKPSSEILKIIKNFLKEKIHENNPLYTMILAEACTRNEKVQDWDIGKLLNKHLEHTEKIWRKTGIDDKNKEDQKHINLLMLATMTNGVEIDSQIYTNILGTSFSEKLHIKNLLPEIHEFYDYKYHVLCGTNSNRTLQPITPDILGEYFVLQKWTKSHADMHRVKLLINFAWQYKPWGMSAFMVRVSQDFSQNNVLKDIIEYISNNKKTQILMTLQMLNIGILWADPKDISSAIDFHGYAQKMWKNNCQEDKDFAIRLALTAANLIIYCCKDRKLDKAIICFNRLDDLLNNGYCNEKEIIQLISSSSFILIKFYCAVGEPEKATELYDRLNELCQENQEDKEISLSFAMATVSMMISCGVDKLFNKATSYFNLLTNLWEKGYQKNKELSLIIARAMIVHEEMSLINGENLVPTEFKEKLFLELLKDIPECKELETIYSEFITKINKK